MTSTPIAYDVVKVSELEEIGRLLNLNDDLIVNDYLESPIETKRCKVRDLIDSIKPYVLLPATTETLGGVIVGDGLAVTDTGLLTNTRSNLEDLENIDIFQPQQNDVIFYDAVEGKWNNSNPSDILTVYYGGDGIEIVETGNTTSIINVKPGQGIKISNDEVATDLGRGLRIIDDKNEVELGVGLRFEQNAITFNITDPIYVTPSNQLSVAIGDGLIISNSAS